MKITHQQGDPKSLKLLEDNARYMSYPTFRRLVDNIKRDGVLQQWPFVHRDPDTGVMTVLSGNHRVKAAIEAGLTQIDWIESDEYLTRDQQLSIQLSHNSIVGEDDPEILKRLYESIEDVEEKMASGLDDVTLDLMLQADTTPLSEVNLDFTTLTIVFLPHEFDRAQAAFDEAKKLVSSNEHWLAKNDQHAKVMQAIEDARDSAHVANASTALELLLQVWDQHREDLQTHWLDEEGNLRPEFAKHPKHHVPLSTILGTTVTAEEGRMLTRALKAVRKREQGLESNASALIHLAQEVLKES